MKNVNFVITSPGSQIDLDEVEDEAARKLAGAPTANLDTTLFNRNMPRQVCAERNFSSVFEGRVKRFK
jgi:hypothetical protein